MSIPSETVINISVPFLVGQAFLYQYLFNKFFVIRLRKLNDEIEKEVGKRFDIFVSELAKLKNRRASIDEKIETIKKETETLNVAKELKEKFDYVFRNTRWAFLLFLLTVILSMIYLSGDKQYQWNVFADYTLYAAVIGNAYLSWKLFELNSILVSYETGKPIKEIIERMKEEKQTNSVADTSK
ncbi:MAG: hypothetical protein HYX24_03065 [Candidatus Aenigmarchaeota archaeon]|nr:hypothetical protein [Candidatus Aenigmarchaeota archaeon]